MMQNKVLVNILVPEVDESYDVFLPIDKKIGNIVTLINKALNELTGNSFPKTDGNKLYNAVTKQYYEYNIKLIDTDIRNGTKLVLLK